MTAPAFTAEIEQAIDSVRADVSALHAQLVSNGLVVWTGGNVSGRVPGADLFVIKPSGVDYDDLAPRHHDPLRPRRHRHPRHARQRPLALERHRRARLRLPQHARGRRRRAHALDVRDRVGGARRADPVRDHGDGRRVRRRHPGRPVRDHRRRLDRARHRRDPARPPFPRRPHAEPRPVHDRQRRARRREGRRDARGRRAHRAHRPPGRPAHPDPAGCDRRALRTVTRTSTARAAEAERTSD